MEKAKEKQQEIPLVPAVQEAPPEAPVALEKVDSIHNTPELPAFSNRATFEHAQRVASMLSKSDLVPAAYKGNVQNTMIALEMANRIGASPLQVMQNLYIVQGKPSWSSSFIVAAINACGKFSPLRYQVEGSEKDNTLTCLAWAYDKATGEKLEGPMITMEMAAAEGWLGKSGSKWKSMPTLMIRYRAAAFFGRLYAPEILMGMHTVEENTDVLPDAETRAQFQKSINDAYRD